MDDESQHSKSLEQLRIELFKVEVEENRFGYGPIAEGSKKKKRRRVVRYKRGAAPVIHDDGQTSCSDITLGMLRKDCNISEEIDLIVPGDDDRADSPPEGHFTLYECYIRQCFLWFPIPSVILEFLCSSKACLAQLTPRSIRHLVGILVRSYECGLHLTADHYANLLRFSLANTRNPLNYYASNQKGYKVIHGFKSKDHNWHNFFFYVPICEASVGDLGGRVKTSWSPIVNQYLPQTPPNFDRFYVKLIKEGTNWSKTFSQERVDRARALAEGIDQPDLDFSEDEPEMENFDELAKELNFRKMKLAQKKAKEAKEAAETVTDPPVSTRIVVEENTQTSPVAGDGRTALAEDSDATTGTVVVAKRLKSGHAVIKQCLDNAKRKAAEEKFKSQDGEEPKKKKKKKDKAKVSSADDVSAADPPQSSDKGVPPSGHSTPADIPEDRFAAAVKVFSQITFPGAEIPPLAEMANPIGFGRVAFQSLQCQAEVGRTLLSYDNAVKAMGAQVKKLNSTLAEQKKAYDNLAAKADAQAADAEARIKTLTDAKESLAKQNDEAGQEVTRLKAEVEDAAVKSRERTKREFAEKVAEAKAKMVNWKGKELVNFVFNRQIDNNLTFLDEVRSEGEKKTLDEFEAELTADAKTYADAPVAFFAGLNDVTAGIMLSPVREVEDNQDE